MSAAATTWDQARFRRAVLDALAFGPAFALDVHRRVRDRGFDVDDLRVLHAQLAALVATGLVVATPVASTRSDEGPRKRYTLTRAGIDERARLGVP